jgi:hypothetical protein
MSIEVAVQIVEGSDLPSIPGASSFDVLVVSGTLCGSPRETLPAAVRASSAGRAAWPRGGVLSWVLTPEELTAMKAHAPALRLNLLVRPRSAPPGAQGVLLGYSLLPLRLAEMCLGGAHPPYEDWLHVLGPYKTGRVRVVAGMTRWEEGGGAAGGGGVAAAAEAAGAPTAWPPPPLPAEVRPAQGAGPASVTASPATIPPVPPEGALFRSPAAARGDPGEAAFSAVYAVGGGGGDALGASLRPPLPLPPPHAPSLLFAPGASLDAIPVGYSQGGRRYGLRVRLDGLRGLAGALGARSCSVWLSYKLFGVLVQGRPTTHTGGDGAALSGGGGTEDVFALRGSLPNIALFLACLPPLEVHLCTPGRSLGVAELPLGRLLESIPARARPTPALGGGLQPAPECDAAVEALWAGVEMCGGFPVRVLEGGGGGPEGQSGACTVEAVVALEPLDEEGGDGGGGGGVAVAAPSAAPAGAAPPAPPPERRTHRHHSGSRRRRRGSRGRSASSSHRGAAPASSGLLFLAPLEVELVSVALAVGGGGEGAALLPPAVDVRLKYSASFTPPDAPPGTDGTPVHQAAVFSGVPVEGGGGAAAPPAPMLLHLPHRYLPAGAAGGEGCGEGGIPDNALPVPAGGDLVFELLTEVEEGGGGGGEGAAPRAALAAAALPAATALTAAMARANGALTIPLFASDAPELSIGTVTVRLCEEGGRAAAAAAAAAAEAAARAAAAAPSRRTRSPPPHAPPSPAAPAPPLLSPANVLPHAESELHAETAEWAVGAPFSSGGGGTSWAAGGGSSASWTAASIGVSTSVQVAAGGTQTAAPFLSSGGTQTEATPPAPPSTPRAPELQAPPPPPSVAPPRPVMYSAEAQTAPLPPPPAPPPPPPRTVAGGAQTAPPTTSSGGAQTAPPTTSSGGSQTAPPATSNSDAQTAPPPPAPRLSTAGAQTTPPPRTGVAGSQTVSPPRAAPPASAAGATQTSPPPPPPYRLAGGSQTSPPPPPPRVISGGAQTSPTPFGSPRGAQTSPVGGIAGAAQTSPAAPPPPQPPTLPPSPSALLRSALAEALATTSGGPAPGGGSGAPPSHPPALAELLAALSRSRALLPPAPPPPPPARDAGDVAAHLRDPTPRCWRLSVHLRTLSAPPLPLSAASASLRFAALPARLGCARAAFPLLTSRPPVDVPAGGERLLPGGFFAARFDAPTGVLAALLEEEALSVRVAAGDGRGGGAELRLGDLLAQPAAFRAPGDGADAAALYGSVAAYEGSGGEGAPPPPPPVRVRIQAVTAPVHGAGGGVVAHLSALLFLEEFGEALAGSGDGEEGLLRLEGSMGVVSEGEGGGGGAETLPLQPAGALPPLGGAPTLSAAVCAALAAAAAASPGGASLLSLPAPRAAAEALLLHLGAREEGALRTWRVAQEDSWCAAKAAAEAEWRARCAAADAARAAALEAAWADREASRQAVLAEAQERVREVEARLRRLVAGAEGRFAEAEAARAAATAAGAAAAAEAAATQRRLREDAEHGAALLRGREEALRARLAEAEAEADAGRARGAALSAELAAARAGGLGVGDAALRDALAAAEAECAALREAAAAARADAANERAAKDEARVAAVELGRALDAARERGGATRAAEDARLRVSFLAREERFVLDGDRAALRGIRRELERVRDELGGGEGGRGEEEADAAATAAAAAAVPLPPASDPPAPPLLAAAALETVLRSLEAGAGGDAAPPPGGAPPDVAGAVAQLKASRKQLLACGVGYTASHPWVRRIDRALLSARAKGGAGGDGR